jgi:hypothetical protein
MKNFLLLALLIVSGCVSKPIVKHTYSNSITARDGNGYIYKLVRPEKDLGHGLSDIALWERVMPADTNLIYFPAFPQTNSGIINFHSTTR